MTTSFDHVTVLLDEAVAALQPTDGEVYVDCTLGGGGHTAALLEAADCRVIGIDRDPAALAAAAERLAGFGDRFVPVRGRFSELKSVVASTGLNEIHGVLADIGVSSPQLDEAERGFSFMRKGPLDMRMDPDSPLSAADIVNTWDEAEIGRILKEYGEERRWFAVARAIVADRPFHDTLELSGLVERVVGRIKGKNPSTRTFQALRIVVNDELGELEALLPAALELLQPGGRLAVITFHSLEDRLVKRFLAEESGKTAERDPYGNKLGTFRLAPPARPITPSDTDSNPRARSARLRSAVRLPWNP